jgi:hypothetical protein
MPSHRGQLLAHASDSLSSVTAPLDNAPISLFDLGLEMLA